MEDREMDSLDPGIQRALIRGESLEPANSFIPEGREAAMTELERLECSVRFWQGRYEDQQKLTTLYAQQLMSSEEAIGGLMRDLCQLREIVSGDAGMSGVLDRCRQTERQMEALRAESARIRSR